MQCNANVIDVYLQEGFEQLAEDCQMTVALHGLSSVSDEEGFQPSSEGVTVFSIKLYATHSILYFVHDSKSKLKIIGKKTKQETIRSEFLT